MCGFRSKEAVKTIIDPFDCLVIQAEQNSAEPTVTATVEGFSEVTVERDNHSVFGSGQGNDFGTGDITKSATHKVSDIKAKGVMKK
jgi:hypothetical protein